MDKTMELLYINVDDETYDFSDAIDTVDDDEMEVADGCGLCGERHYTFDHILAIGG